MESEHRTVALQVLPAGGQRWEIPGVRVLVANLCPEEPDMALPHLRYGLELQTDGDLDERRTVEVRQIGRTLGHGLSSLGDDGR